MGILTLVVEDDADIATVLRDRLQAMGHTVTTVGNGQAALEALQQAAPGLMLLDIELPKINGMEVLKRARKEWPELPVIVMTAFGTIPRAVEAMKEGATDFITKPFDNEYLNLVIGKALERGELKREVTVLRSELESRVDQLVTASPKMNEVIEQAKKAAQSDSTVLLLGESGTGKDLLARSIHNWSGRRNRIFKPVNCVALSEELLVSELFGHEKGSFTGATSQKRGILEIADGGTVFLDEIGDMKPGLQAKLLRFLQNREFDRVGGTRTIHVDVRVIAATNRDLRQAVKAGAFREDLFFRLNVVTLTLPPLRERTEEIPQLAGFFLKKHCLEAKKPAMQISLAAMKMLAAYPWPGNVRELQNALERAVVLKTGEVLTPEDFALQPMDVSTEEAAVRNLPFHESVEHHKREIIRRAIARVGGSQTKAAELLGLQRTYLARLIKQMDIK
ncbi:MAG: sigma-54-dependent Fis family transcriptional regulator [Nitrospirae bacterium]|nr:MAG: sigma-54-dependent Fis family transcriptional regulator [Nitrospirota bacterium]